MRLRIVFVYICVCSFGFKFKCQGQDTIYNLRNKEIFERRERAFFTIGKIEIKTNTKTFPDNYD